MSLLRMRGAASGDDMNLTSACAAAGCFDTASTPTAGCCKGAKNPQRIASAGSNCALIQIGSRGRLA